MTASENKLPVLILAYNRPDFTAQLMEKVAAYKPGRLYVACDGPKRNVGGDNTLVEDVRKTLSNPTWDTTLSTRFAPENKGPRLAVGGAISWFFDEEPAGIILEDDCMPSLDFFRFSEHILVEYEGKEEVWGLTGSNTAGIRVQSGSSFSFSRIPLTWGWATWANRWEKNDADLRSYITHRETIGPGGWPSKAHLFAFQRHLDSMENIGKPDAWDYPWAWSVMSQGGLWVVPEAHLVDNVGFRGDSTNTKSERLRGGPVTPLRTIRDPSSVEIDAAAENLILRQLHNLIFPLWLNVPVNFIRKLKNQLLRTVRFRP